MKGSTGGTKGGAAAATDKPKPAEADGVEKNPRATPRTPAENDAAAAASAPTETGTEESTVAGTTKPAATMGRAADTAGADESTVTGAATPTAPIATGRAATGGTAATPQWQQAQEHVHSQEQMTNGIPWLFQTEEER
jgi:hypothetical protein